jgi:hypothetical protein
MLPIWRPQPNWIPKKPKDMFQMERKEDAIGVGDGADFIGGLSPKK